jgi:phenylacetate-coenzyme A ligase PaaK-like adenylate-forming protein
MVDVVEYAGATALPAGHLLSFTELLEICRVFEPNVLTGDTTQIVNFASYIKSKRDCDNIKIDKILFTSEPMNLIQRSYIDSVFSRDGNPIQIISVLGSAEAGVWAVADFSLTGPPNDESTDFIFDSRHMIVECLPMDWDLSPENGNYPCARIEDKVGLIAITSLQRLRNPLVRYLTGDIGSIHQLSDVAFSKIQGNTQHLRVLRLYGRDIRQSFTWEGEYFEFFILKKFLQNASWGILKWQVVLDYDISVPDSESLEIRLIRTEMESNEGLITKEELVTQLKTLFWVHAKNEALFYVDFCKPEKFVRSATGNKVLMFIDQRKKTS